MTEAGAFEVDDCVVGALLVVTCTVWAVVALVVAATATMVAAAVEVFPVEAGLATAEAAVGGLTPSGEGV